MAIVLHNIFCKITLYVFYAFMTQFFFFFSNKFKLNLGVTFTYNLYIGPDVSNSYSIHILLLHTLCSLFSHDMYKYKL